MKLSLFAVDFSSREATSCWSQTKELSRRLGKGPEASGGWKSVSAQGWPKGPPHLSSVFEGSKLPSAACGTDGSATAEGAQGRRDESDTASPPLRASAARAGVSRWGTFGVHVASGSGVCFSGISSGERKSKAIRFQAAALLRGSSIVFLPAPALRQGAAAQPPKLTCTAPGKHPLPSFTALFFFNTEKRKTLCITYFKN